MNNEPRLIEERMTVVHRPSLGERLCADRYDAHLCFLGGLIRGTESIIVMSAVFAPVSFVFWGLVTRRWARKQHEEGAFVTLARVDRGR